MNEERAAKKNFQVFYVYLHWMMSSNVFLQEVTNRVEGLRQKASSSRQKVDEAKSSQASNKSSNAVLDSLTKLQHTGRINGFHVSDTHSALRRLVHDISRVGLGT